MARSHIHGGIALLFVLLASERVAGQPEAPEQHSEKAAEEVPAGDQTSWAASLGGTHNAGNTEAWQVVAGSELRLVRGPHGYSANAAFAYGRANVPDDDSDELQDTVRNFVGRMRYDYFFTEHDALFVANRFRWDQFAGLDARVQGQIGYLRVLFKAEEQRLWSEVGYDLTYDNFHPLPNPDFMPDLDADDEGLDDRALTPEGEEVIHSARVFAGYDNQLNEVVTYAGGIEALMSVENTEDVRVFFDNALRSKVAGNLQIELMFTLQYDTVPVPGAKKYDTQTRVSLIYNLL